MAFVILYPENYGLTDMSYLSILSAKNSMAPGPLGPRDPHFTPGAFCYMRTATQSKG
jgi:hypothetical protein